MKVKEIIRRGLIVSCQALEGNPLRDSETLARLALAAEMGGACGIRANGPDDIRAIRAKVSVPIIGINKKVDPTGRIIITPDFNSAKEVAQAGANIIAIDATFSPSPIREETNSLIKRIHDELCIPVMADISSLEEAIAAVKAGADLISTTLSGYTPSNHYSPDEKYKPDIQLLKDIINIPEINVPVIGEGRFWDPKDLVSAFELGVYAVVIGKAITNPIAITRYFVDHIEELLEDC